ncbi:MAG: enoyl-CoA hydratase/isomerase family protein [Planctomycetes bacterium]|nr:enoyl-CoA hydratase/isomerase family protein [Planctomycetota bacterium]
MTEKLVRFERRDGIAILTLCDPPANAYTHEMMRDLDDAILRARFDDDVKAIVLTGDGEKFFCAGANIQMLEQVDPGFKYYFCLHANETLSRLEQTPKLVVAALNGHCVGGGFEVALACDLRIARKAGGKCGLPEVSLGVLPGTGGTQRLLRLMGRSRAMKLMIEGKNIDFETAQNEGLIDELLEVDSEGFLHAVLERVAEFLPPARASLAVGLIKRACVSGSDMSFDQGLALERELQQQLFRSDDAREGMAAFNEKRKARFSGK